MRSISHVIVKNKYTQYIILELFIIVNEVIQKIYILNKFVTILGLTIEDIIVTYGGPKSA